MVPGAKNHGAIPKQRTLVGTFFVAGLYNVSKKKDSLSCFIAGACSLLPLSDFMLAVWVLLATCAMGFSLGIKGDKE
jgi:hypothetical protein